MIPGVQPGFKSLSMEARRALVCPEIINVYVLIRKCAGVRFEPTYCLTYNYEHA